MVTTNFWILSLLSLALLASALCPAFPWACSHGGASPTSLRRPGSEMNCVPPAKRVRAAPGVCELGFCWRWPCMHSGILAGAVWDQRTWCHHREKESGGAGLRPLLVVPAALAGLPLPYGWCQRGSPPPALGGQEGPLHVMGTPREWHLWHFWDFYPKCFGAQTLLLGRGTSCLAERDPHFSWSRRT